jgi:hypothetical protein
MPNLHFTKSAVGALPNPKSGQQLYRDNTLKGFGLRVGAQSKVFFAEGQVRHRTKRVSIGRADVLSVDVARKRALAILSDMALGNNPNEEKKIAELTLEQAFNAFLKARDSLAPRTVSHYQRAMTLYLSAWRPKASGRDYPGKWYLRVINGWLTAAQALGIGHLQTFPPYRRALPSQPHEMSASDFHLPW